MVKIYRVTVQIDRKPFTFSKVELLREVDEDTARHYYERSIKHMHIHACVVWFSPLIEKELGIVPETYCYLEGSR